MGGATNRLEVDNYVKHQLPPTCLHILDSRDEILQEDFALYDIGICDVDWR